MKRKLPAAPRRPLKPAHKPELVVITGLSGSGKVSVLKALEDLGFYSVDNLPVELISKFAELTHDNPGITAAALVVDVREGKELKRFPEVFAGLSGFVNAKLIFLEADDSALVRRFSETRRPHPLGGGQPITSSIRSARVRPRRLCDLPIRFYRSRARACTKFPLGLYMPASSSRDISASPPAGRRWCGSKSAWATRTRVSSR